MTPIIYFDHVRVSKTDLELVHEKETKGYYNMSASRILRALERYSGEPVLFRDDCLPRQGLNDEVTRKAREIADTLLAQASIWSETNPALVSPLEIKEIMTTAYKEWLTYNQSKADISPHNDPLKTVLLEKQIPRSKESLQRLEATRLEAISGLLINDKNFNTVFCNIIRNAYLISTIPEINRKERVYDVLIKEFLPAVSIVQRYEVFIELPEKVNGVIPFNTLMRIYDIRLEHSAAAVIERPRSPEEVVIAAFRERKRFSSLRKRMAELDELIQVNNQDISDPWVKEVIALNRELQSNVDQIDKMGTAFMWASGAYFLQELLSSLDPSLSQWIRILLVNPFTARCAKESLKSLYIASKGIKGGATSAIASVRDYVGHNHIMVDDYPSAVGPGIYDFWVEV